MSGDIIAFPGVTLSPALRAGRDIADALDLLSYLADMVGLAAAGLREPPEAFDRQELTRRFGDVLDLLGVE
jgi:hypothetical protein